MPTIAIREEQQTETGFTATLSFDGRVNYPIAIVDPATGNDEQRLEWYFEDWIKFPLSNEVRAEEVVTQIRAYGESLFGQIFADRDAYSEYQQLRNSGAKLQIEIISQTLQFQALHWEALRDPDLPNPVAIEYVMVRKSVQPVKIPAQMPSSPYINVLLVTARPDEEDDISYRATSRPLIAAIENSQLPVRIDLLRPGTYEALDRHLSQVDKGYYQIIHFDCHGGLISYELLSALAKAERTVLKARWGRSDLAPYEGIKAFLSLEGEEKGKADLVEAAEIANLLINRGIPICILDACQSGKQVMTQTQLTSLGGHLMAAGMQMVLGMSYSISVSAASQLMATIYQQLFGNQPMMEAIRLGRFELFKDKRRTARFNRQIPLEDWILPVVYSNREIKFNLREFTPQEEEAYFAAQGSEYRFAQPEYQFVGRDLDILKIEKGLLRRNILLLQGMGGTGKTTLLRYLREWWQKTHFAEQIFYFGYDAKAWTLAQIMFALGQGIYDKYEQAKFQAYNQGAQMAKLVTTLRSSSHILILDNLESVTGQTLAIQNTLPAAEQEQVRDFLGRLVGGKTRVVLGSRSGEDWLQPTTFQTNIYQLRGLDPEARSLLAKRILERHAKARVERLLPDPDLTRLMKLLAGYPLAMEVILPNLKHQSPAEILAGLEAADIDLDTGSEDKTKSIIQCVEYSHNNLSADAQKLLLCLAPFSGFIDRHDLDSYAKQLQELEPFKDYDFARFDDAVQEAIDWGLLSPMAESDLLLTIQPVFPYFLKTKLATLDEATRNALAAGFKNHYQYLARSYQKWMESKEPQERQSGIWFCRWEYENLYHALQACLANRESIDIFFCLFQYLYINTDNQSALNLSEFVCRAQSAYPPEIRTDEIGLEIVMALGRLAYCYLQTKNYHQARSTYQKIIELSQALTGVEATQIKSGLASTYHQLGRVAEELREYAEARRNYQLALEIKVEFGDRYSPAFTYHQLGMVAEELREYEEAQRNYQLALEIKVEFGDRHSQASTYHQLGRVAQAVREYAEAQRNYQLALEIFVEFGDRYAQASTYHQLGSFAQEVREYEEARRNYQLALEIYVEFSDRYSQASTYHQLGRVAQQLREYEQARRNYQLALEIYVEFSDRHSQASTYHQLGRVAQELREYEQARRNYQLALEIKVEFSDRYSQASTYGQLGLLAEAEGNLPEAETNLLQALEIFNQFEDSHSGGIAFRSLARIYAATQSESLLAAMAQILGVTVAEVRDAMAEGS
jgi:tetratricopeptide (TPR) repeat protein